MSVQTRRLQKIETSLTPTQAVLLWLDDTLQHGSLIEHARWLKEQPEAAYPLVRLPRQVRQAVREAAKGQPRDQVDVLIRQAERDVTFLYELWSLLTAKVVEAQRPHALAFLFLLERFRRLLDPGKQKPTEMAFWREHALPLAGEVYALATVVEQIQRQYFGGRPVLFADDAAILASTTEDWDNLLAMYRDHVEQLPSKQRRALALTAAFVRDAGRQLGERDTRFLVAHAKAETLRLLGDHLAAANLMEQYV